MTPDEKLEWSLAAAATTWIVGMPVSVGFIVAKFGAEALFLAIVGSPLWPAVLLGWLGYWVAS